MASAAPRRSILALVGSMTPAALAKKLVATLGRLVHPALMLAACLVALGGAGRADAGFQAAPGGTLRIASYNVQFVTPELPVRRPAAARVARAQAQRRRARRGDRRGASRASTSSRCRRPSTTAGGARSSSGSRRKAAAAASPRACRRGGCSPSSTGPDVERGSWLPLVDDELALASRLPIVAAGGHVRACRRGGRARGQGRAARPPRARPRRDVIDVFVTHLQAGDEHGAVRRAPDRGAGAVHPRHRGRRGGPGPGARRLQRLGRRSSTGSRSGLRLQLPAARARRGGGAAALRRRLARDPCRRPRDRQRHQAAAARGRHAAPARGADRLSCLLAGADAAPRRCAATSLRAT